MGLWGYRVIILNLRGPGVVHPTLLLPECGAALRVWGLGFGVLGLGFGVWDLGFRFQG